MPASGPTVLIVNPNARGGWVGRKWPTLEPLLRTELASLGDLSVRFTTAAGQGQALGRQALQQGARVLLALGGDGTASEVAAALLEAGPPGDDGPCFGFLPCGTGGDLRRTHGTPQDLRQAAQSIAAGTPRFMDAGQLDYTGHDGRPGRTYFINIASFGIGGLVDALVNQSGKALGGSATFFAASLRATWRYRNALVRIALDDGPEEEIRIYNVAVSNGRFFGGGMQVAPQAQVDDGLFDVVKLGDLTLLEALLLGKAIYKGQHLSRPKISMARARKVVARQVDPAEKVLLDVDGETPGRLPATFTLLERALRLRV